MNRTRLSLLVLGVLGGCGDDHGSMPADAHPDTGQSDAPAVDAPTGDVPRVEAAPCRFTMPSSLALVEGADYVCGDLVVEENRATHAGRIRVHYIRIKSTATTGNATIYLDGGPGGDGSGILNYAGFLGRPFLDGLLVDGDFLVISQRGTALSVPYLDCQTDDCSDFGGVADLASYNTAYNADDVNDLRSVLGIAKLDLYGISYGSRLGLEVLRRHGAHVRAAVIEGLVPSQVQWHAEIPRSAYGAITALNASCADAGACGTTFGDLVAKFVTGVDALNANPVDIDVQGSTFPLDGYTYASLVFQVMYSKSSYAYLPLVISDVAVRRTDRIGSYLTSWFTSLSGRRGTARGLYYGVVCGEVFNPPDPNAVATATAGVPQAYVDIFGGGFERVAETCATYPKGNLQASLSQPVTSAVRTLVSSGRLDPITPPSFATIAAATLSNSVVVVHANSGHGATLQSACGVQNLHAFLADPTGTHDMTCAGTLSTSYVIPSGFASLPAFPIQQLRADLALAPIVPPFQRARR
ncbi:MAG: alpha/beta hydrolase [Deltaproteobacteria bacterium]|nr:alpha/beta hydrolase [Deltaproteobacteria bacterium]